jgi:hypothetical protein
MTSPQIAVSASVPFSVRHPPPPHPLQHPPPPLLHLPPTNALVAHPYQQQLQLRLHRHHHHQHQIYSNNNSSSSPSNSHTSVDINTFIVIIGNTRPHLSSNSNGPSCTYISVVINTFITIIIIIIIVDTTLPHSCTHSFHNTDYSTTNFFISNLDSTDSLYLPPHIRHIIITIFIRSIQT